MGTGAINWWKATHPEPPPPPTVDFGPLPAIVFPEKKITVSEFQLQTPTGSLGRFSDRALVFYAPAKQSGFLDPDRAIELARRLNFLFEPIQLSETLYRWTKPDPIPTSLEVSIVTGHYKYRKQWQADPSLAINKVFVSERQTIMDALSFLRSLAQQQEDIVGYEKVSFLRVQGDQLVPAISLSEGDFVEVNFFRRPYEVLGPKKEVLSSFPFYTADPKNGLITIMVSGSMEDQKKVIETDYKYVPIQYDVSGEYPIKSVELAFEELKSGSGHIASFLGSGPAVIRRVNLGYYDAPTDQKYAMPIYVFTGDQEFTAYVSAVDEDQIIKK